MEVASYGRVFNAFGEKIRRKKYGTMIAIRDLFYAVGVL